MSSIGTDRKPCRHPGCTGSRPYWSDMCKAHRLQAAAGELARGADPEQVRRDYVLTRRELATISPTP